MKAKIEQILMPLVGEPLSDMWRVGYCWQCFEFGPQFQTVNSKGKAITRADFRLHLACEWNVYHSKNLVLGSSCYGPGQERREPEEAQPFFHHVSAASLVIESLSAADDGDFILQFSDGYSLEILARNSLATAEYWRFLLPHQHHWFWTSLGLKEWREDESASREMDYETYDNDTSESDDDYFAFVDWISGYTATELRTAKPDPDRLKQALCRYYKRGYRANLTPAELIDFLAVSSHSIFEIAGYTDEEVSVAMLISDNLTEEEIEQVELPINP